ncbi:MAG TPA: PEP-CTERM sorting domain-containing protein [Pirellulaceae bacterium]|mgnify:CR=1 FL=1|nr:PEP-CTERM sorting domain-containing protein [Pirellulaceae bacterium]
MKISKLLLVVILLAMPGALSADVITEWTFEGSVLTPSTGAGTASNVGGTSSTFATGNGGGIGWNTSTYPAQGNGSGTAGVQFLASTAGYKNITIDFDHRASGTASRWSQLQYTTDGTNWNAFGDNAGGLSPHDTFYSFNFDLSSISGVNNNPNFGIRVVSIFSPLAFNQNASLSYGPNAAYMRANAQAVYSPNPGSGTGDYGTTGTWRFDNVKISGDQIVIPEPSALAVLGLISLAGLAIRRRGR